jgi:hypothetical protein
VIDSFSRIDPALIDAPLDPALLTDGHPGYTPKMEAEDTTDAVRSVCGAAARDFPPEMWIEPRLWAEWGKKNDEYQTWGMNYLDRYTNQQPTHECTCHSLIRNFEAARNRQRGIKFPNGPKKGFRYPESSKGSVWLSPLSVYNEANPGQWGGANVRQVLEIACKRGILPDKTQPFEYGFKHAVQGTTGSGNQNQSSGPWMSVRNMPAGWEETAKWFMPDEVIFPESWEQAVCLVLHGLLVSVGRNGHAIPWALWNDAEQAMAYPDSYDVTRYDSLSTVKRAWQGAFAIRTVTAPDDWMNPVGVIAA